MTCICLECGREFDQARDASLCARCEAREMAERREAERVPLERAPHAWSRQALLERLSAASPEDV